MLIDMVTQAGKPERLNGKEQLNGLHGIPPTSCCSTAGSLRFVTSRQAVSRRSSLVTTSAASGMVGGRTCHLSARQVLTGGRKVDHRRQESMRSCRLRKAAANPASGHLVRLRSMFSSLFLQFHCSSPAPSHHPRIQHISRSRHRHLDRLRSHHATPGDENEHLKHFLFVTFVLMRYV